MGSIEFTVLSVVILYGIFAVAVWTDVEAMHQADRDDVHHTHAHN